MVDKVSVVDVRGMGKEFHDEVCHFIAVIVDTANVKGMLVGNYRGWLTEDIKVWLVSKPSDTPWHIDAPGFTVCDKGPFSALDNLLSKVMESK